MKITAITRYKHGGLYLTIRRLGWNQAELARQSGITATRVGEIINLRRRPSIEQANAIQRALAAAGEFLDVLSEWPETFVRLKRGYCQEQTAEVPMERLLDHPEVMQLPAPEIEDDVLGDALDAAMNLLSPRDAEMLRDSFFRNKTQKQIAEKHGMSISRAAHLEYKAFIQLSRIFTPIYDDRMEARR